MESDKRMTYLLTVYQSYEQHGKNFKTLKELSEFAVDIENRELGYCTTYTNNTTKKSLSGKAFRNWLDRERHIIEAKLYKNYPCFSCDGKNCETCKNGE
jgi:hypothetical protein